MIVSWDGAGDLIVDRMLAEGHLPHLAALAERGVSAQYSVPGLPSKTAVGHAVLWTGCGPACNGVSANTTPLFPASEHTLLERRRGFSSAALTAEPLYVTAARAGRRVTVLSATQSYPPEVHVNALRQAGVPEEGFRSVSGFEQVIARSAVLGREDFRPADPSWEAPEGSLEAKRILGDSVFHLLIPQGSEGFGGVLICPETRACGDPVELKPASSDGDSLASWSPAFAVQQGGRSGFTFFRLFELAPDGSSLRLYRRGVHYLDGAMPAGELEAYRQVYQGFHDVQFRLYESGALGPPLMLGGDGQAEERVLELTAFDVEQSRRATRWAIDRWQPEVLFHYLPMADPAGHTWYGVFDPTSPSHDPATAEVLWPYYARVFALLDGWLGSVLEKLPSETAVVVTSDHGMAGVSQDLLVNAVLEQAGLLVRLDRGGDQGGSWRAAIDLSRTRILAAEFGDAFFLKVNDTSWKDGIVAPEDREAVLEQAAEALLAVRHPVTGEAPVTRVFRPQEEPEMEGGGPSGGDLYFSLAPGYYPRRGLAEPGVLFEATRLPWGEGQHGFPPRRREMHAIFYAAGPGLRQGVDIGPIRHIDVAPTVAALLGISAPPQATGRVVVEALGSAP
ncbi:MAG: alkaline phosphatase family protein [Acidobacteriota bacterium]